MEYSPEDQEARLQCVNNQDKLFPILLIEGLKVGSYYDVRIVGKHSNWKWAVCAVICDDGRKRYLYGSHFKKPEDY
jgi:hypothetical protein